MEPWSFAADLEPDSALEAMDAAWRGEPGPWAGTELRDRIVAHAVERCRHYRRVAAGRAFEEIPVLTRDGIREDFADLLAEGVPAERLLPLTTSGSTGAPLLFFRDRLPSLLEEGAARRFLMRLHGVPEDATWVWLATVPRTPTRPWPRIRGLSVLDLTEEAVAREVAAWQELSPYVLYGHASGLTHVAAWIRRRRRPLHRRPLAVITTSDMLTEPARALLERTFGRPVHSWYGSHEVSGFVAGTIPGSRRYAFNPLLCWVEVLDEGREPSRPGHLGRLVITDLNNRAFPLIRYDTGDLAVASDRRNGAWRLVARLEGRSGEFLQLAGGGVLSPIALGESLLRAGAFAALAEGFQCVQTGPEELELRVVWAHPPSARDRECVREALRRAAGPVARTRLVDVPDLKRTPSGKVWILRRAI